MTAIQEVRHKVIQIKCQMNGAAGGKITLDKQLGEKFHKGTGLNWVLKGR